MHGSSPLPSPPSPGSGASPSSAALSASSAFAANPDVAILAAHERLAELDPFSDRERLFDGVLAALLTAAHAERGVLVDPLRASSSDAGAAGDPPVAIPLTARDETLALLVLEKPPADPVGFASVTAHAARLLDSVRMAAKVQKADFELKYRVWELQSLYDVGLSIAGTLDFESLAEDILYKSISLLNARTGTLIVCDRAADTPVTVRHLGEPLLDGEQLFRGRIREEPHAVLDRVAAEHR